MAAERRRNELILLTALVVLAAAAYRLWPSRSAATPAAAAQRSRAAVSESENGVSRVAGGTAAVAPLGPVTPAPSAPGGSAQTPVLSPETEPGAAAARQAPPAEGPSVHLDALTADRPKPVGSDRNLFQFKPKAPPRPPMPRIETAPPQPAGPPPTPPPPAIALKFIGVVDQGGQTKKIAILSDSAGHVFYGHEGDIIEGRYRVIRIGAESLEIAYLDGTGRRIVRLSGG